MTHNPFPCVQGLLLIPCLLLSWALLRCALAMWLPAATRKRSWLLQGYQWLTLTNSVGKCLWKHFQWKIPPRDNDGHPCWYTGQSDLWEWPDTWIPWFIVLPVMLYDPWPILPACGETQTLSGTGAHLKIQNSHGLTVGRKQGRGFLDCFKM